MLKIELKLFFPRGKIAICFLFAYKGNLVKKKQG